MAVATVVVAAACSRDDSPPEATPTPWPTPIAFTTPPEPIASEGILEFSPACDAAMIRAARQEAPLADTILHCRGTLEWQGAAFRYPAAIAGNEYPVSVLMDLCFRATDEQFAGSGACQQTIGGRTPVPSP